MEMQVICGNVALLQYGLYSSFMSCFVYIFLGSCKDITIGPTAIMGIMTNPFVVQNNPDFAVLLCFLVGCVMVLVGSLRLGKSTRPKRKFYLFCAI
jgi:sodium-independent sulfate anion transporter 11